jgi:hypothetical protein
MKTNIKNKKVLKLLEDVGLEQKPVQTKKLEDLDLDNFSTEDEKTLRQEENLLQLEIESLVERSKSLKVIDDSNIIEDEVSEEKRQYDENLASIRNKLERPFSLGRDVDTTSMREAAANNVLPKSLIPKQISYPEPFEEEPALNRELAEFKQKINEHLSKMGFAGGGGGAGFVGDLDDVNIDSRTHKSILMWNGVTNKYEVADPDLDAGIANEDDSGDEIILNGTTTSGADESGSIQQENETRMSLQDTTVSSLSLSDPTLTLTDSAGGTAAVDLSSLVPNTATLATTFTSAANDSTNETVYPVFVDGQTGAQDAETDVGFTYNPSTGILTALGFAGPITGAVTGNADTATALETARNIGGTSFDGTGNISVALATVATTFTSAANDSTDETVYPVFVDGQTGAQDAETDVGLTYNPSTGLLTTASITANLLDYGEVTNAIGGTGGGSQDIDLELGNSVTATVDTSANTFTFSNPVASDELCGFTLGLTNGGSQTVNWPGAVDWAGGSAPTLTTSGVDWLVFWTADGGTIWNGGLVGAAFA